VNITKEKGWAGMAKGPTKQMWRRMVTVMGILIVCGFGALIAQLARIQIVSSEFYQKQAIEQQLRDTVISPKRGTIYDRNKKTLAKSASVWTVVISPKYIKTEETRKLVVENLARITGVDEEEIAKKAEKNTYYEIIKRKIEDPMKEEISKFVLDNDLNCIRLDEDNKRYYPYGNFASSIIGFTGTDNQGLAGIEAYYEKYLKGVPGRVVSAKNAWGTDMPFQYERMVEPQNGNDLVLTIDEVIQHFLEKNLETAVRESNVKERACGIVMDVNTGEILAMANKPDFDLNAPFEIYDKSDKAAIESLTGEERRAAITTAQAKQWRNKAISDTYEPGSVFKIITGAMAMEEGAVKPGERFYCSGSVTIANEKVSCHKTDGHGSQTFEEGLQNSCNPVFITLGNRMGALNFYKYFNAFGLTGRTGIDLPGESDSIFHNEKALQRPLELAISSFGQTFRITPIQMITAVSTVANGGNLIKPHIVKQVLGENGQIVQSVEPNIKRQVISKETSKQFCNMLEKVVSLGTGKNAYVSGYRIAGKTGTSVKTDSVDKMGRIASFCAVAPADDPKIAVLIMLDEPKVPVISGGLLAAPVVGNIIKDVLPYLGIEPKYTEAEIAKMDVSAPVLIGKTTEEAKTLVEKQGLTLRVIGSGGSVKRQVPDGGRPVPKNGTVIVYTEDGSPKKVTVPNLVGFTPLQVNRESTNRGLNLRLTGAGLEGSQAVSFTQSIAAGTEVEQGTIITVEFRHKDNIE